MSLQGWNPSTYVNAHRLSVQGGEHSRSTGSSPTLLACRICDKIFLSAHSLIEHYQSHEDELASARQHHPHYQRTNFTSRLDRPMVASDAFQNRISPSPVASSPPPQQQQQQQQRYHPYFPNGNGPRIRLIPNTNTNRPFLAHTQPPNLLPRHPIAPVANNGSAASNAIRPIRNDPILAASARMVEQKGFDQTVDKRTAWFLWQLEKPIPKIIDLEVQDEKYEGCNLDLTLKI